MVTRNRLGRVHRAFQCRTFGRSITLPVDQNRIIPDHALARRGSAGG